MAGYERPKCPKCGAEAECFWRDVGGVEYYDEYTLVCENCGHVEKEIEYGGSPIAGNWVTCCPFCGKEYFRHPETPQRYW